MKCPVCEENALKSTIVPMGGSSTMMYCDPYYDEEGVYHDHDYNSTNSAYRCSNGHVWTCISYQRCPSCDWICAESTIRIIKGAK